MKSIHKNYMQGLIVVSLCLFSSLYSIEEKPIVVVIASYNNSDVCKKNLYSVFSQEYNNWRMIYVDDCSTDGTADLVEAFIHQQHQEDRVTLIRNTTRLRQLHNQYDAIHSCPKDAIIALVDGDDWLAHPFVLEYINEIYQSPEVWLTYGQFVYSNTYYIGYCAPFPADLWPKKSVRTLSWVASHLRTFYAGLFHKIALKDLLYEGDFFSSASDLATMFPMLEMAGPEHVRYIDSILYVYNNDIPAHRCNANEQKRLGDIIRSRPPYKALTSPPHESDN